ncbi:MAG: carboxymuconolactone decarboxylase family protein [Vulcanimicrobiaceae bacterium]
MRCVTISDIANREQTALPDGAAPDPLFAALRSRPQVARTLARHLEEVASNGTVAVRTKELCALMVAWLCACDYCTCAHEEIARRIGVDRATLDELGNFAQSGRFAPAERAALAATVALTREPRGLPPGVRAELERYYDEGEIVEIVAAIGLYNYLARASNALGVGPTPASGPPRAPAPAPL